jgi:hypothetical protein
MMLKALGWFLLGVACGAVATQVVHEANRAKEKDLESLSDAIEDRLRSLEAQA